MKSPNYIATIEELKSRGAYEEAHKTALELLKKHTDDYRLYEELSDIALYDGRIQESYRYIQLAQELHPDSLTGKYLLGSIHVALGNFPQAVEMLSIANESMPNNPEILRHLGWANACQGAYLKGIALLRRSLSIMPDDRATQEDLGISLMSYGEVLLLDENIEPERAHAVIQEGERLLRDAGAQHKISEFRNLHD